MRRFARWAFNILSALSLLLCLASAAAAVGYRGRFDSAEWVRPNRVVRATLRPLGLYLAAGSYDNGPLAESATGWRFEGEAAPANSETIFAQEPHVLGFYTGVFTAYSSSPQQCRVRYVIIPFWALAAGGAVLPAVWVARWRRERQRRMRLQAGLCPRCGYDLRATPELCPECGFVPVKAQSPE